MTGNRADAERALATLVTAVQSEKTIGHASTVSELLEAWFAIASTSWAPTTVRETRSILDRCLHPHLGHHRVGDVTPAMIDATYATLRVRGSVRGGPLKAGTLNLDPPIGVGAEPWLRVSRWVVVGRRVGPCRGVLKQGSWAGWLSALAGVLRRA